jgi:DNA-binding response OmpR family regulator
MAEPDPLSVAEESQSSAPVVVLLEDDPRDAFFVRRAFVKAHISNSVLVFTTAAVARQYLDETRPTPLPALFILDLKLAGGETGIAFLRWLRQQRMPLGSTPAMMLTGSSHPNDQDEAGMLGSIYFLVKPVTGESLTTAVTSLGCVRISTPGSSESVIHVPATPPV